MKVGKRIIFIVGPTGTGKTELALRLARICPAEILSADSMQVYQGMDVGTAKPEAGLRRRIKHHLIDRVPPSRSYSIYKFRTEALKCIEDMVRRRRIPLVVGGSGLYIKALLEGLTRYPPVKKTLRLALERKLRRQGVQALVRQLERADPLAASRIDRANPRRVLRALELALSTKMKCADRPVELPSLEQLGYEVLMFGLTMDRAALYQRVEGRVDEMFSKGWIREVKALRKKRMSRTARQAIGYRELLASKLTAQRPKHKVRPDVLQQEQARVTADIKKATRHLVKRQGTWFRAMPGICWLDVSTAQAAEAAFCEIKRSVEAGHAH